MYSVIFRIRSLPIFTLCVVISPLLQRFVNSLINKLKHDLLPLWSTWCIQCTAFIWMYFSMFMEVEEFMNRDAYTEVIWSLFVDLNDPCGSLPTQDTLWIHNSPLVKMGKYSMSPVGCQNSKVLISLKAKGQNLRDQVHISAFILIIYRQKLRLSSVMGSFFLSCLQNSCTCMHKAECSSASFVHTNTTKGKHLHFGEKKQIDFQKKYGGRKPQWYQTLSFGGALKVKATKYPF